MIQAKENEVYLKYANVLFDFFRQANCLAGQGGFLMRTMRTRYGDTGRRTFLGYLYKILFNLCQNGFLEAKDGLNNLDGWINLTESGADYLQGGPLIVNKVNLSQYIDLDNDEKKQFDDLWSLIGKDGEAPFYIKGPTYHNMIRPYISDYLPDYNQYMEERRQKEKSTSRVIWYRELYLQVKPENREAFLSDLSYAISLSFYYPEQIDEDYMELFAQQKRKLEDELALALPGVWPELQIESSNKKQTPEELLAITIEICNKFKSLVEDNRIYRLLYNDDNTPKDETAAQLLFYSIASGYCKMHDVDINRESDPGIGELDFKFSVGSNSKVVIEMKLSTNKKLSHGFEKQLPAYLRAEEACYGILLVICLSKDAESELVKTQGIYQRVKDDSNNNLTLICIDATPRPSASQI